MGQVIAALPASYPLCTLLAAKGRGGSFLLFLTNAPPNFSALLTADLREESLPVWLCEPGLKDGVAMKCSRLNLSSIRKQRGSIEIPYTAEKLISADNSVRVSRRSVLGLAGLATALLPSALKAVGTSMLGEFSMRRGDGVVAFAMRGKERWVLDCRLFGGSPQLSVEQDRDSILVELASAFYPGTTLPADLVCRLTRGLQGWRMELQLAFGDFQCNVPFEQWLLGSTRAFSSVSFSHDLAVASNASVQWNGRALAYYAPDKCYTVEGKATARVEDNGSVLVADRMVISLPDASEPWLLAQAGRKRSVLTFERGDRSWLLRPRTTMPAGWSVAADEAAFSTVRIECTENRYGVARRALVAETAGTAAVALAIDGFATEHGEPFQLPLQNVRYAVSFDDREEHSALVASFAPGAPWLQLGDCSFHFGATASTQLFELISVGGVVQSLCCIPSLLGVVAPLAGAIVAPIKISAPTPVAFMPVQDAQKGIDFKAKVQKQKIGVFRADPEKPQIELKAAFRLPVLRPEDMLALEFEFVNFKLSTGSNARAQLTRETPGKASYIIVHFQPQSIAEEAFFEAGNVAPPPTPPGQPADPDKNSSTERPTAPPVKSLLSGPSRIAFLVPASVQSLEYSLDALLDWRPYTMSVPTNAIPPPAEVILSIFLEQAYHHYGAEIGEDITLNREALNAGASAASGGAKTGSFSIKDMQVGGVFAGGTSIEKMLKDNPSVFDRIDPKSKAKFIPKRRLEDIDQLFKLSKPTPPTATETAIEAPYRVILSPNVYGAWAHSRTAVEHNGRTELWHTRLGVKADDDDKEFAETGVDENNPYYRTLRAIWSPDFAESPPAPSPNDKWPFRTSLTKSDRHQIVAVTSDFRLRDSAKFEPLPIRAERFMLSTLGVWMNTKGDWSPTQATGLSIEEWTHRATMARDHFVRVVYKGFLFPFGHRASLVKITERKFQRTPRGDMAAYMRQRLFIVVREQTKTYPVADDPDRGREFPFSRVNILTHTTPNIEDPQTSGDGYVDGMNAFWVRCNGQHFQFHMVGEDYAGQRTEFSMPLVFVSVYSEYAYNKPPMDSVRAKYLQAANVKHRVRNMGGQKIAYAPQKASGDTTFETNEFFFSVRIPDKQTPEQPRFYPVMEKSFIGLKAVDTLVGANAPTAIQYYDIYVKTGLGGEHNKGEVFAKLAGAVDVDFAGASSGDKSGGLITPNFSIKGLSRLLGPVSGDLGAMIGSVPSPGKIANGQFDPAEFFSTAFGKAKILGGITLADIISLIDNFQDGGKLDKVPKMLTQTLYDAADVEKKVPKEIVVSYEWKPDVKSGPSATKPLFVASRAGGSQKASLVVMAELRVKLLPAPETSFSVTGTLENFSIDLIAPVMSFLLVEFKKLSFSAGSSGKPVVDSQLGDISFEGPLKFVSTLQEMIPKTGGDLIKIDVKPTGVGIGFNLALPSIEVGMFSLQNLAFSAALYLPFTGDPMRIRFAFCERQSPFLLTVSMFGGGGFFAIALGLDGMETLEAAFEFGANISLNLGVASGGVYIMAGIYFKMEANAAMLEGYLRCGGSLSVLGLITVSVEFYMSLTYLSPSGKVYGQATLKVKVEVLFFSKTVSLTVERQFKGSAGDPLFHELVEPDDWEQYCRAFA